MWRLGQEVRVYLALGTTDLRCAIQGLSTLVQEELQGALFSGNLYVFCNRRRNQVKLIYWDRTGFCLWQKRLEKSQFKWPQKEEEVLEIGLREFEWLLDGLDIQQAHETLSYSTVV